MRKIISCIVVLASGCGGGSSSSTNVPPAELNIVDPYVGEWVSVCAQNDEFNFGGSDWSSVDLNISDDEYRIDYVVYSDPTCDDALVLIQGYELYNILSVEEFKTTDDYDAKRYQLEPKECDPCVISSIVIQSHSIVDEKLYYTKYSASDGEIVNFSVTFSPQE